MPQSEREHLSKVLKERGIRPKKRFVAYGKEHPCWKGDDVSYSGLHYWISRKLGKPRVCEMCGTKTAKKYEWANISGEYKRDKNDFIRLCVSCHRKMDGHSIKAWNTRRKKISPNKKTVFFTIVSDEYYYPVGTHILVNSFKRFHPDIDLVVYRQDMINEIFHLKGINFYMAKPSFAKLLTKDYDRVINIDADTIITGRLTEVLDTDWEVGAVWNFNLYENASLPKISETKYVQAGMVGSTNPKFWDIWEKANKEAMQYERQENDILNILWYTHPEVKKMKRLIWDRKKNYLGCKSLGGEQDFYIEDDKLMYNQEQIKAYHWAKGKDFPKMDFDRKDLKFVPPVVDWLKMISYNGISVKYTTL